MIIMDYLATSSSGTCVGIHQTQCWGWGTTYTISTNMPAGKIVGLYVSSITGMKHSFQGLYVVLVVKNSSSWSFWWQVFENRTIISIGGTLMIRVGEKQLHWEIPHYRSRHLAITKHHIYFILGMTQVGDWCSYEPRVSFLKGEMLVSPFRDESRMSKDRCRQTVIKFSAEIHAINPRNQPGMQLNLTIGLSSV